MGPRAADGAAMVFGGLETGPQEWKDVGREKEEEHTFLMSF